VVGSAGYPSSRGPRRLKIAASARAAGRAKTKPVLAMSAMEK
jgi:hypothetical protein